MLNFNAATGLTAPSAAEIRAEVAEAFVAAFQQSGGPALNTEPETPAGQLIDSITAFIEDKNAEILYLANQFNPLTASGIWQAAIGKIYYLTPRQATARTATCTCAGLPGTVIAAGSLIQCTDDGTQWAATETVTIPANGAASVGFQCTTMETDAAPAESLTRIVTVTPGWDTVTNASASTAGSESETRLAFEQRRFDSVAVNSRGGVSALYGAIMAVDGVLDCVIIENSTNTASNPALTSGVTVPAHSVWITVDGGEGADIAEAIYRNKDAGCGTAGGTTISYQVTDIAAQPTYSYSICRPTDIAFGVRVNLTTEPSNVVAAAIKSAIIANFNGENELFLRAGAAQTIFSSRFYNDVIAAGGTGLVSVEIAAPYVSGGTNTWLSQISLNADSEPVLDDDSIIIATA